jgi:hypothetical protein
VLDADHHILALCAFDIIYSHLRSKIRILFVILEVASAEKVEVDVDTGSEQNLYSFL